MAGPWCQRMRDGVALSRKLFGTKGHFYWSLVICDWLLAESRCAGVANGRLHPNMLRSNYLPGSGNRSAESSDGSTTITALTSAQVQAPSKHPWRLSDDPLLSGEFREKTQRCFFSDFVHPRHNPLPLLEVFHQHQIAPSQACVLRR